MRLLPTLFFGATVLMDGTVAEESIHQLAERRGLQEDAEICPSTFSLMHCRDPSIDYEIPCDPTTCLWDLTALQANAPPGICSFIRRIDVNDDLPDRLKPCILWNQFFGTLAPTISPKPTSSPIRWPTTDLPTAAPSVETRIFKMSLDRKIINLFFRSPSGLVNTALNDALALGDLEEAINGFLQEALRSRTGHDIVTESVLLPIDEAKAPWKNSTSVAAMALTTRIKSDSSKYEIHEFHIFVADALRADSLLERLQALDHRPFERIYSVLVGPIYLEDAPSRDIQTDRPTGESPKASAQVKWWTFWKKEFWQTIQWGDWNDKDFIALIIVISALTLIASVFASSRGYKILRRYKLERDVLNAAQLTLDEGSIIYALCDVKPSSTGERSSNEQPEDSTSVRSETFTYAEDDSRDIQSFSIAPGTNMSAMDFSFTKCASSEEKPKDEDSIGSKSTISHQPVDLEQGKGTVVCYDIDNDSLSTTSDSMVGSMLDFVRAAWQKKKPQSPQQSIFNQKIPKVPVARETQSSVMAVVASLEAAAKSSSPKPISPRKINVLSVVEEIERENLKPLDIENQGGIASQDTEEISQACKTTASTTVDEVALVEVHSSGSPEVPLYDESSTLTGPEEKPSTPEAWTKSAGIPVTPEKKPPPPRKLTLENADDTPQEIAINLPETEKPVFSTPPMTSAEGSKKSSVLAFAAAFEKLSATTAASPPTIRKTKKPGTVSAAIASFEQSSKKAVDTTVGDKDFESTFRELAFKKVAPDNVSPKPADKVIARAEPMKILPIVGSSSVVSPAKAEESPVSILKPTVSKGACSVMDAIKAFENRSPIPIEGKSKPIKQSVSFDDSLPSLSRLSKTSDEKMLHDRPSRDLSSAVRLTKLMDETGSISTKKTIGTSSMSSASASRCKSPTDPTYILRTTLEKDQTASPARDKSPRVPFFRSRSKSDASLERFGMSILRSWSDKSVKDSYSSPAFCGKSARNSKASKIVLSDVQSSPGLTPVTLPETPVSPIEYQESETSDIKSICSKECFGSSPMR